MTLIVAQEVLDLYNYQRVCIGQLNMVSLYIVTNLQFVSNMVDGEFSFFRQELSMWRCVIILSKRKFCEKKLSWSMSKRKPSYKFVYKKPKRQAWKSLPFVAIVKRVLGDIEEEYWVSQH